MTAAKNRKQFTPEFKWETVALITEQGYSIAKAAQAVGTNENNVRRWKAELEAEATGERLNSDERAELVRLRRENKESPISAVWPMPAANLSTLRKSRPVKRTR